MSESTEEALPKIHGTAGRARNCGAEFGGYGGLEIDLQPIIIRGGSSQGILRGSGPANVSPQNQLLCTVKVGLVLQHYFYVSGPPVSDPPHVATKPFGEVNIVGVEPKIQEEFLFSDFDRHEVFNSFERGV